MSTSLLVAGLVSIALGLSVVVGARRLLPRLDVSDAILDRLVLVTAGIGGLLLTFGVIVGLFAVIGKLA